MQHDDFLEAESDAQKKALPIEALQATHDAEIFYQRALAMQMNSQFEEALFYYDQSIACDPLCGHAWNNRGTVLFRLKRVSEALESYTRSIAANPHRADAFNNQGVAFQELKRFDEALQSYEAAVALRADYADAFYNLGTIHQELGHLDQALHSFDQAIVIKPDYAEAFNDRGSILQDLKRYSEALASYDTALKLRPSYAEAFNNRGTVLQDMGRLDDALNSYQTALSIKADYVEAMNNQGNALRELNHMDEALARFQAALLIRPDYAEALNNQGYTLYRSGRIEEALKSYEAALVIKPHCAKILVNKGVALQELGRLHESLATFNTAISHNAAYAEAISNKANVLWKLKRFGEALAHFDRAIALEPKCSEFRYNKGLSELALGILKSGWEGYEWRLEVKALKERLNLAHCSFRPRWRGEESITGKTLFLHSEYSLSDTVQFCRYVPRLLEQGAKIILEVAPRLKTLLKSVDRSIRVIAQGETVPEFDFYTSLMSLPHIFDTSLTTIPANIPYLEVDAVYQEKWRSRFNQPAAFPRIGLGWSEHSLARQDEYLRLVPLEAMSLLTAYPFHFHALQNDIGIIEKELLAFHTIENTCEGLEDYAEIAAAILQMDLIITMDTSIAHVAGALGKPVWILLPYSAEWRWFMNRSDSPWYPTARLFRQTAPDDWAGVIEQVYQELSIVFNDEEHTGS